MTLCLGIPVYSTGHQVHTSMYTFQMAQARGNILRGHKAKLSGVIKPKEDKGKTHHTHSFSLYDKQYKRQRQKKTMTISGRKRIDRKRENLLTNLHQSHYTQGNSSTGIFSCQSKFLKRTLTTLTSNRSQRPKSRRLTW